MGTASVRGPLFLLWRTDHMHGGNWAEYGQKYGRMPLDFSANISPLGVPESVKKAVIRAAGEADRYPDPSCRALREAIGKAENIVPEQILCGNGAADLIWRLAAVCRDGYALLPVPSFSEYCAALQANGCKIRTYATQEADDFRLTEAFLPVLAAFAQSLPAAGRGILFLCNPGNPSGTTTEQTLLLQILEICFRRGILVAADECFLEFLDDPEEHTLKDQLTAYPNLVILRAMTKIYAMAGIRTGYCFCADRDLLAAMQEHGQPWSVSHPAQCAGMAAAADRAYRDEVRALIRVERKKLQTGLRALGFRVIPGEANYLLFYSEKPLSKPLWEKGILIRDCSDYEGLGAGWYRTAVRTHDENRVLLGALAEICR